MTSPAGALRELLGAEGPGVTVADYDGGIGTRVEPTSVEGVVSTVELAGREGWRVVPRGAGTWTEGTPPVEGSAPVVVLSTAGLTEVVDYEPADLTATVQAGASLAWLQERVGQHGQWLPVDPSPGDQGTLGGMMATGAVGPLAHAYGAPRDLALGLQLVAGDARLLELGGRVVKNVAGFDLVRVAAGSWGAFGVITSVTVRLFPKPEEDLLLTRVDGDVVRLDETARAVARLPVEMAGIQIWTTSHEAGVAVRILGSRDEVDRVVSMVVAETGEGWSRLEGAAAEAARARLRALGASSTLTFRLSALPSRVRAIRDAAGDSTGVLRGLGWSSTSSRLDAQNGTLELSFGAGRDITAEPVVEVLEALRSTIIAEGGGWTLVRAPLPVRRRASIWPLPTDTAALTRGVVDVFDPNGVMPAERFGR